MAREDRPAAFPAEVTFENVDPTEVYTFSSVMTQATGNVIAFYRSTKRPGYLQILELGEDGEAQHWNINKVLAEAEATGKFSVENNKKRL